MVPGESFEAAWMESTQIFNIEKHFQLSKEKVRLFWHMMKKVEQG